MHRPSPRSLTLAAALVLALPLRAQENPAYRTPSPALTAIVDAPLTPGVSLSPDRTRILLLERPALPPVAELAEPELRLAGLRINPATNGPSRAPYYTAIVVKAIADGAERRVAGFPALARITSLAWSPDGRHLLTTVEREKGVQLWLVDIDTATARQLTPRALNGILDHPAWVDARTVVASFVPAGRGTPPAAPTVPTGPVVQENLSGKRPARTYADMLTSPHDETVFEYYATSELALVTVDGHVTPLGLRGLIGNASPSPDGQYLLVTRWTRPYSYLVPVDRFPTQVAVHDRNGRLVHTVADLPLAENIPIPTGSVRTGPRNVAWRSDAPATLSWVQALDGGDAGRAAALRDEWFTHAAPFTGAPVSQQKFALRAAGITWGDDRHALVTESWWKTRRTRTWLVAPGQPGAAPTLLFDRSSEDRYAHPGTPVLTRNTTGRYIMLMSADRTKIFLDGLGASPEGDRPFLDEFDLTTKTARRLWRSTAPNYETFVAFLDSNRTRALTQRESVTEPANYFVRTLGETEEARAAAGHAVPEPLPAVRRGEEGTDHIPAGGWRFALGHTVSSSRIQSRRRSPADAALGLPARIQGRLRRQPGARVAVPVHPREPARPAAVPARRLRGARRPRDADHRRGHQGTQRHLHPAARREREGGDRRTRPPRRHGPEARGGRRPQLRRLHDREPARALGSVPRRHRAERRVQPHAHAVRLPGRGAHALAGARNLRGDVAVQPCAQGQGSAPPDPRRRRQQRRHVPDPERAFLQRAQGPRRHDAPRHAPARVPRLPRSRKRAAHALGIGALARHLREAAREGHEAVTAGWFVRAPKGENLP